jgi:hypothetical protein
MFRYRSLPSRFLFATATFLSLSLHPICAHAETLTDPLDSWRFTGGASHGVVLDTTNANYFYGDNSRAKCDQASVGSFYYHLPGITSFAVFAYYFQNGGSVEVFVSPDGQTWSSIPLKASTPQLTTNNQHDDWTSARIEADGPLPAGTNYIGFTLHANANIFTPQIGQVSIQYGAVDSVSTPGPRGLSVLAGDASALLTWYPISGADSYDIERRSVSESEYHTVAKGVSATSYTDHGLTNGKKYYYTITAATKQGRTGKSDEVLAVPGADTAIFHDPLTDWSLASSHDADLAFGQSLAGANVVKRKSTTRQTITYKVSDATKFAFNVYSTDADLTNAVAAEASTDGSSWKPVAMTFNLPAKLAAHSFATVCATEKELPAGTNFVRFILGADGLPVETPQVSDIRIASETETKQAGKSETGGS